MCCGLRSCSYSADGALFDWLGGREHVPYVVCAEVYGGPELPSCFEQFNPSNEALRPTLASIHALYASLLQAMAEEQTSARLGPGLPLSSSASPDEAAEAEAEADWRRRALLRLCEAEEELEDVLAESVNGPAS